MAEGNVILERSFGFAVAVVKYCEILEEKRKFVIANQLLRAGTSIGANIREAQAAESRPDFIHKMKIAAKEADETEYWLDLCNALPSYPPQVELQSQLLVLKKLLSKIISTSKKSIN